MGVDTAGSVVVDFNQTASDDFHVTLPNGGRGRIAVQTTTTTTTKKDIE